MTSPDLIDPIRPDLELLASYDRGTLPAAGDSHLGLAARALVAAVRAGGGPAAMRDGVVTAGLAVEDAGLSVRPGTLAICALLAAAEPDDELAASVAAEVLRGSLTNQ